MLACISITDSSLTINPLSHYCAEARPVHGVKYYNDTREVVVLQWWCYVIIFYAMLCQQCVLMHTGVSSLCPLTAKLLIGTASRCIL